MTDTFGQRIKKLRHKRGQTGQQAADCIGICRSILYKYEQDRKTPCLHIARAIADYYGVTLDWLTGRDG